jgi:hypothetical protein
MNARDNDPLHEPINAKLAEVVAGLSTPPPWLDAWTGLCPDSTEEARLAVARVSPWRWPPRVNRRLVSGAQGSRAGVGLRPGGRGAGSEGPHPPRPRADRAALSNMGGAPPWLRSSLGKGRWSPFSHEPD